MKVNIQNMIQLKQSQEGLLFLGSELVQDTIIEYYLDQDGKYYFLEV
jgi:hypothetical protein